MEINRFASEPKKENRKEKTPEEKEALRVHYQLLMEGLHDRFVAYAKAQGVETIPHFRFAREEEKVKTAHFTHNRGDGNPEIVLGTSFFVDKELSDIQAEFVMMHEVTHSLDWKKSKEAYEASFEKARRYGEVMTARMSEYYEKKYGEQLPFLKMKGIAGELQKLYDRGYFNVLDDIWVNHTVATDDAFAHGSEGDAEREKLYREKMMPERYLDAHTLSHQFLYAMLREENIEDQAIRIDEKVEEALHTEYTIRGKAVTVTTIIDDYFNPLSKVGPPSPYKKTDFKTRHDIASVTILKTYNELLFEDMCKNLDRYHDDPLFDIHKAIEKMIEDIARIFPDFIPHDAMKEWASWVGGKAPSQGGGVIPTTPKPPTPEDDNKKWRIEHKVKETTHERMEEVLRDIAPHVSRLDRLWNSITRGSSREKVLGSGNVYRRGTGISMPALIASFPQIITGKADVAIMTRNEMMQTPVNKPERIELSLILDRSGSMFSDINKEGHFENRGVNSTKNKALERVMILVMKSLERFNASIERERKTTKTKLTVDTEIISYGDDAEVTKPFRKGTSLGNDRVAQYTAMEKLSTGYGGNNEAKAIEILDATTGGDTAMRIEKKKLLKVAILITDGGSMPDDAFKAHIASLQKKGIHIIAFQIGEVDEDEKVAFQNMWNAEKGKEMGFYIGKDLSLLVPSIATVLENELSSVAL